MIPTDAMIHACRFSRGAERVLWVISQFLPMDGIVMANLQRFGWMLAFLCLAGCAEFKQWMHNDFKVGPDYCKPVAPVAHEWIDFNDPAVISENHAVNDGAWWQSLNDPVLDQLVKQAYEQNLSLRAAGMRVLEARAQRAIAAGLLFPQFQEGAAGYNRIQLSTQGNPAGIAALPVRAFDLWSSGFNASWELDLWGKFRRNLESADANLDSTIENHDDVLVCLIAETAAAYVDMRAFEQRLKYASSNVEIQQVLLEIAESRFRNGAGSELDVTVPSIPSRAGSLATAAFFLTDHEIEGVYVCLTVVWQKSTRTRTACCR
jgi:hypothetical protein